MNWLLWKYRQDLTWQKWLKWTDVQTIRLNNEVDCSRKCLGESQMQLLLRTYRLQIHEHKCFAMNCVQVFAQQRCLYWNVLDQGLCIHSHQNTYYWCIKDRISVSGMNTVLESRRNCLPTHSWPCWLWCSSKTPQREREKARIGKRLREGEMPQQTLWVQ